MSKLVTETIVKAQEGLGWETESLQVDGEVARVGSSHLSARTTSPKRLVVGIQLSLALQLVLSSRL